MRVIATARYERNAKRLLTSDEQTAMEQAIADNPQAHPVIPGTGGIRKARWARQGGGKSGGVRTIYYYFVADAEIRLLFIYAKTDQADLTADQRKELTKDLEEVKNAKKKKR